MNPRDIIGAWFAALIIWGAAMFGLVAVIEPARERQSPAPQTASVDDWYSSQWEDRWEDPLSSTSEAANSEFEWDEADRPLPPAIARRNLPGNLFDGPEGMAEMPLPAFPPPSGQKGTDNQ